MKYTYLCYNPSKDYSWSLHRAGCPDIVKELKGIGTNSGFPAEKGETFDASSLDEALDHVIDEDLKDMGYTHDSVHVFSCCRKSSGVGLDLSNDYPGRPSGSQGDSLITHRGYSYTTKSGKTIHVKPHTERKPPPNLGRMKR